MVSKSLQDQLLKAGLANQKQVDALRKEEKQAKRKKGKKKDKGIPDQSKQEADRLAQEKAAQDRALNAKQQAAKDEKAQSARIQQLIETNLININGHGQVPYHFTDGTTIHRLYLPHNIITDLSRGAASIVRWASRYHVIVTTAAERIAQINPELVITRPQSKDNPDEYSDFPIPDDLMW